jgi:hypothetical protein
VMRQRLCRLGKGSAERERSRNWGWTRTAKLAAKVLAWASVRQRNACG